MRILLVITAIILISFTYSSCKSNSGPPTFCDTACFKDTLKFVNEKDPSKPYLYVSAKNCMADSVLWSYSGMGSNRKLSIADLAGSDVRLNRDFIRCIIPDTSYIHLMFNDCLTGRGFYMKIPYDKKKSLGRRASAVNSLDPKFSVADGLAVYTDRGNIFVEEMASGKKAMMTFGKALDPDYDNFHKTLDSVNITPSRIWVKVKIEDQWKELEKKIALQ